MEKTQLTFLTLITHPSLSRTMLTQIVNADARLEAVLNSGRFQELLSKENLPNLASDLMTLQGIDYVFDDAEYQRKRVLFKTHSLERDLFMHLVKQAQLRRHGVDSTAYMLFYSKAVRVFEQALGELFAPVHPFPGGSPAA